MLLPVATSAQQLMGTSGDWRIFTLKNGNSKTCYIASVPTKKAGTYTSRDEPYVLVTKRGKAYEVSVSSGYKYKKDKDVEVKIDNNKPHGLFVDGELAWAYDAAKDAALVKAMKAGTRMIVQGTSWKDTISTDTYSLSGITRAIQEMDGLCK